MDSVHAGFCAPQGVEKDLHALHTQPSLSSSIAPGLGPTEPGMPRTSSPRCRDVIAWLPDSDCYLIYQSCKGRSLSAYRGLSAQRGGKSGPRGSVSTIHALSSPSLWPVLCNDLLTRIWLECSSAGNVKRFSWEGRDANTVASRVIECFPE